MKKVKNWAKWNDKMVLKYHAKGTLFESKNPITKTIELWRIKTIKKLANYNKNDFALDLGCGEGFYLQSIKKPRKIVGIDISKIALKRAKEINKGRKKIKIIKGDALDLKNIKNKYFDKVTASELLEHIPHPRKAIKEISRILKNNGLAVISIPDEKVIQKIVRIIKLLRLKKWVNIARNQENYEWHLHNASLSWLKKQIKGYFIIDKLVKLPPFIGYRIIVRLKKINYAKRKI